MTESDSRTVRWTLAIYRVVSRLLPVGFRDAYRDDLLRDVGLALREARRRGRAATIVAAAAALRDLLVRIPRERWTERSGQLHGRTRRGERMMTMWNELRLAARSLGRRPGFTATSIVTLALGIGANAAIFAVVHGVLLQPLDFPDSDRVVSVRHHAPGIGLPELANSPGTVQFYRDEADFFTTFAAYDFRSRNLTGGVEAARVEVLSATPNFTDLLRTPPAMGRPFNPEDAAEGAPPVALLTHRGWQSLFGGDAGAIGSTVELDGRSTEIVGVMPEGFSFLEPDVMVLEPLALDPERPFGRFGVAGVARLAPGVSVEDAARRIEELQTRVPEYFADQEVEQSFLEGAGWSVSLTSLRDRTVGDVASTLWIVLGTVGFVLLIACANVANLFLVRAESRQRELAVRVAMGAGRGRIAVGFLSESLLLGLAAGAVGAALAWWSVGLWTAHGPRNLPRLHEVGMDPSVLGFTFVLSVVAGLAFGALPLTRVLGGNAAVSLRSGARGSTEGRERHRVRNALVASQLALALVLLVGSGLMFRSFERLRAVDLGFDVEGVLVVGLSWAGSDTRASRVAWLAEAATFYRGVADEVVGLGGVEAVGVTNHVPMLAGEVNGGSFYLEGRPREEDELPPTAMYKTIDAGYLAAMGIPLLAGRTPRRADWESGSRVAWVNETFARSFLDGDALGEGVHFEDKDDERFARIVGVLEDVREFGPSEPVRPMVYFPLVVGDWGYPDLSLSFLVIKTERDPALLVPDVRAIVRRADAAVPITVSRTMEEVLADATAETSLTALLLGVASAMALLLGAVGLFGVVSYVVAQRTREIGVRVAVGARSQDIQKMVLRQGVTVAVVGVLVGLVGSLALSRVLEAVLFEVSATDPFAYVIAPPVLLGVAALATWLPARRASRVEPTVALRAD